jgi:hypothetical protein
MIDPKEYPNRIIERRMLAPSDTIDRQVVSVNLAESPLGWLHRHGHLDARQVAAGERLRRDHHVAGLDARVTMRWDPAPADGGRLAGGAETAVIGSLNARRRFAQAIDAVGPGLSDILWRVVCAGEGLADAERGLKWPMRSGKLVLGMALDRLAAHYDNRSGNIGLDNRNDIG